MSQPFFQAIITFYAALSHCLTIISCYCTDIIAAVNSPQVKLLFDIYHQQISEGHLIHNITSNIDRIGHFHAAGNPGRHELTVGEIDYRKVFDAIRGTDYDGFVGLEYWPLQDPVKGLSEIGSWFR